MKIKMSDVARDAGVSVGTVSYVLSGKRNISEDTKNRVLESVKRLGYTPDRYARALKTERPVFVGVVVPSITSMYVSTVLQNIEWNLADKNVQVIISNSRMSCERELENIKMLTDTMVDGIIIAPIERFSAREFDEFSKAIPEGFPALFFEYTPDSIGSFDRIVGSTYQSSYQAVESLVQEGCKRIGTLFANRNELNTGAERRSAYFDVLRDYGIAAEEDIVIYRGESRKSFGIERQFEAIQTLIDRGCDGIFAPDQPITESTMIVLGHEKNSGRDVKVAGFHDYAWSVIPPPNIGLVHQQIEQIGKLAAETIMSRIENGFSTPCKTIILPGVFTRPL